MPRRRIPRRQPLSIDQLSIDEILELEVGISYTEIRERYGSDAILRERWKACRVQMMPQQNDPDNEDRAQPGTRPWAWWRFEAKEPMPATLPEQIKRLQKLKELAAWEVAVLRSKHKTAQMS